MALTPVTAQNTGVQSASAASASKAYPNAATVGNWLVIGVVVNRVTNQAFTVSDSVDGTTGWALSPSASDVDATNNTRVEVWRKKVVNAGTYTVTVTPSGGSAFISFGMSEWSGGDSTEIGDSGHGNNSVSSTAVTTGTIPVNNASEALVGCCTHQGSLSQTITESDTLVYENESTTNMPINFQYKTGVSAGAALTWTLGASALNEAVGASLKPGAAGGPVLQDLMHNPGWQALMAM